MPLAYIQVSIGLIPMALIFEICGGCSLADLKHLAVNRETVGLNPTIHTIYALVAHWQSIKYS